MPIFRASCLSKMRMIYKTQKGQVSTGEAIGILLLDTGVPFIPGDVANATTYYFPVRFQKVEGFTVSRAIGKDPAVYDRSGGGRGTGAAGRAGRDRGLRVHGHASEKARPSVGVPVFLSSLLQIPFIRL